LKLPGKAGQRRNAIKAVNDSGKPMLSLVASTLAFFVFGYFIKRWADENDIPRGMTRNVAIFVVALALAYAAAWLVEKLV
jgi:hypothetical protein